MQMYMIQVKILSLSNYAIFYIYLHADPKAIWNEYIIFLVKHFMLISKYLLLFKLWIINIIFHSKEFAEKNSYMVTFFFYWLFWLQMKAFLLKYGLIMNLFFISISAVSTKSINIYFSFLLFFPATSNAWCICCWYISDHFGWRKSWGGFSLSFSLHFPIFFLCFKFFLLYYWTLALLYIPFWLYNHFYSW